MLIAAGAMRRLTLVLLSALFAVLLAAAAIEIYVRVRWDPLRGRPGLFVADPIRIEKLAANYDGWFAGVRVHINALGFRDVRDYDLTKRANTFRILVLGDSVTFGHGSVFEHTYPYLLQQRLAAWRPDIDWEVWNLGVPGYNTTQELAQLLDVGPTFKPDLVIVGFFVNDIAENRPIVEPSRRARTVAAVTTWLRAHLYSYDLYRRAIIVARARHQSPTEEQRVLGALAMQEQLLSRPDEVASAPEQRLTRPRPFGVGDAPMPCARPPLEPFSPSLLERTPTYAVWLDAVRAFARLGRQGTYDVAFFVNDAPSVCETGDVFDPRGTKERDEYYLHLFASEGLPIGSSHDAFLRYRPSQMPMAGGHSIGNANVVKADVLFPFLRDRVLPAALARHSAAR